MDIEVIGVNNEESAALLRHATEWYARKLMPRLVDKIAVAINVKTRFEFNGEAGWADSGTRRPRVFVITLKNMRIKEVLKTLAHEMVHVKQYARGELKDCVGATRWKDRHYPLKSRATREQYWFQPWEIEAYGMEVGLFECYADSILKPNERLPNRKL